MGFLELLVWLGLRADRRFVKILEHSDLFGSFWLMAGLLIPKTQILLAVLHVL